MIELSENLKEELKDLFIKGSKYSVSDIIGKEVTTEYINNLIDNLDSSANTIGNLKNEKAIKEIMTKKGVYFVCKNGKDIKKFCIPNVVKSSSKGRDLFWYKVDKNDNTRNGTTLNERLDKIGKSDILYIGKTEEKKNGLRGRIYNYIKFGNLNNKSANTHAGGRAIWQIEDKKDIDELIFCWIEIDKAADAEEMLIENYKSKHNGERPLANQKNGG